MTNTAVTRRPDVVDRLSDWFDAPDLLRFFDRPLRRDLIRVEQEMTDGNLTIRAEMPGIDPAKDVDITVDGNRLTIKAERRETTTKGDTYSEFRYGSFSRMLTLPGDVQPEDVTATYTDGILSIVVPVPEPTKPASGKVEIQRS